MLRVVIIDDEFYFRNSLIQNVRWDEHGMCVVGDANDGLNGEQLLLGLRPDIALVDINMPGQSGLEMIAAAQHAGLSACRYVILTGYDDFKFAQRAISLGVSDYVLKPVNHDALAHTLDQLKAEIHEHQSALNKLTQLQNDERNLRLDALFSDLIGCRIASGEAARQQLLGSSFDHFSVALVAPRQQATYEQLDQIRGALESVRFSFPVRTFVDAKSHLVVLANVDPEHLCSMLEGALSRYAPFDVGLSTAVRPFDQLCVSYGEALIALRNQAIYQAHATECGPPGIALTSERKNQLLAQLLDGDGGQLEQTLREIYAQLYANKAPYDRIALCTLELTALLVGALERMGIAVKDPLHAELGPIDELEQLGSMEEFLQWILRKFRLGMDSLAQIPQPLSNPTQAALDYIGKNLGNPDLSVTLISKILFMDYSHICFAFKRDMGLTVNEYITQRRLERAKEHFESGASNISYVARLVGYEDANYFSKSFKKKEGLTPSEFIRLRGGT